MKVATPTTVTRNPEKLLLVQDDIVVPMRTAYRALCFAEDFAELFSSREAVAISGDAWFFLIEALGNARMEFGQTIDVIRRTFDSDAVLVPAEGPAHIWRRRRADRAPEGGQQ
jgi:hypothetical protein